MNFRELIREHRVAGRRRRGARPDRGSEVTPEGKLTTEEIVAAASEAGFPLTRQVLYQHEQHEGPLTRFPELKTVRGMAAAIGKSGTYVAMTALESTGLARQGLAELVERLDALVGVGVDPGVLMAALDGLREAYLVDGCLVLPEGPTQGDADVIELAGRAQQQLARRRSRKRTAVPTQRSSVERVAEAE